MNTRRFKVAKNGIESTPPACLQLGLQQDDLTLRVNDGARVQHHVQGPPFAMRPFLGPFFGLSQEQTKRNRPFLGFPILRQALKDFGQNG